MYTQSARFDGGQKFLSEDEMFKIAPSIFATAAHPDRSAKFRPIATIETVRELDKAGFGVVGIQQNRVIRPDRGPYSKHMLRLRPYQHAVKQRGDTIFEVLMSNANDGTGTYKMLAGLFRVLCMNSLVAMSMKLNDTVVRHVGGNVNEKVVDATYTVLKDADRALNCVDAWRDIRLSRDEQLAFAKAAVEVRYPKKDGEVYAPPVQPMQYLIPRRSDDVDHDLWTTTNVIQENMVRGGVNTLTIDARGNRRRAASREITSIDNRTNLNRALWTLAEEMAKLKA
jgi:hypothetical protein